MAQAVEDQFDTMSFGELIGNVGKSVETGFKAAASQMRFPGRNRWSSIFVPQQRLDYAKAVGDGRGSSIIMACLGWMARNFPEAPLAVESIKSGDRGNTPVPDHDMLKLVRRPNPFYSGALLWNATVGEWMLGNAYWRIIRGPYDKPVQLWWLPSQLVDPKFSGTKNYVDYYEYRYDSVEKPEEIDPRDIVHFRNGLDPENPRKGLSSLGSLLREIFTDEEGASYTATLLANLGVPGMIISPGSDNGKVDPKDAELIKAQADQKFSNQNRGRTMVLSAKANVVIASYNPQQMQVRDVRKIPEERVTAVLGLPAVVVGLGAGLDRSTFANFAEAREAAYESFMIPNQRLLAEELSTQLLPFFESQPDRFRVFFDLSEVRVLQADENEIHARAREDFKANLLMLDEARDMIGEKPLPNGQGQVFAVGIATTLTPVDELIPPEPPPTPEPPPIPPGSPSNPPPPTPTGDNLPQNPPLATEPPPDASAAGKSREEALAIAFKTTLPIRTSNLVVKLRTRLAKRAEKAVASYFNKQKRRVITRLEESGKALDGVEIKELTGDDVFDVEEATRTLTELLSAWYLRSLEGMHAGIEDALDTSFELDDARTREYLKDAGKQIRGISEETLGQLRAALIEGQATGEGIDALAKRIEELPAFGAPRSTVIARTELGHATNTAALYVYLGSKQVKSIRIFDGEEHAPCALVNGKILSIEEAQSFPTLGHPNCVRAFGAIVD